MSAIAIASTIELIAMGVEIILYTAQVRMWQQLKNEYAYIFSVIFLSLAMFAASNLMYSLLGLGLFPRGGQFDTVALMMQQTGAWITTLSMVMLIWRTRCDRDRASD